MTVRFQWHGKHHAAKWLAAVALAALGAAYLATRQGPLLEALREPAYFSRCFVDAGALCWPNGLELSAARLHELANAAQVA